MIFLVKNNEKKLKVLLVLGKFIVGLGVNVNGCMFILKCWFFYFMFLGKLKLKLVKFFFFLLLLNSFLRILLFWKEYLFEDDKFDLELLILLFEDI